jgi:hypothetical protein
MRLTRLPSRPCYALGLPALALVLAVAHDARDRGRSPGGPSALAGWDVPRLADHLRASGLRLRAVSAEGAGRAAGDRVFLTTADEPWEHFNGLVALPEQVGRWRGTVFCERLHQPGSRDEALRQWGECGLRAGPFVLFGDPDLLAQVRQALPEGGATR